MPKGQKFSKSEYRMASNIGLSAGELSFASLFASILTILFWGYSYLLARKFKI